MGVISGAVSEFTWRSGQPSFSCHLPYPHPPLFPLWPVWIASCLLIKTLSYILLSFLLLGSQQLSIKGSGECMCLGDLIPSSSCNEFGSQIQ